MDKELKKSRESAKKIRRKILKSATGDRESKNGQRTVYCPCKTRYQEIKDFREELERRVKLKEDELREGTEERLKNHLQYLKDRFNNILRNEQIRTSAMLREANRDKQEKIAALRTQLECANMAALVYAVCCERRRKDVEIAILRDEYASYVETLEQLLADSQALIDNLVQGYRSAGRVDEEWRGKMTGLVREFIAFIEHFGIGEASHLFDMPQLLETAPSFPEATERDVCTETAEPETVSESTPVPEQKQWWERLDDHPFLVFGDMSELLPGERLSVLREVKRKKQDPEKWREYAFNNLSLRATCSNWESIKRKYRELNSPHVKEKRADIKQPSDMSRHQMSLNVDYRSRMGSIVKMITSNATSMQVPKTSLLAAKDSLEIMSVTKLRSRVRPSTYENEFKLRLGNKIDDLFEEKLEDSYNFEEEHREPDDMSKEEQEKIENLDEDDDEVDYTTLGSMAADSMLIQPHVPDVDSKISTEKICPEVDCQRKRDEFLASLPPYMRASPTTYYDKTYEQYETCTPEQLQILEKRIEERKRIEKAEAITLNDPLDEWAVDEVGDRSGDGNGDKKSGGDRSDRSEKSFQCTCMCDDDGEKRGVLSVKKLYPVKRKMDRITKELFFDDRIQFDRFKVVGQDGERTKQNEQPKLNQIKELLQQYPSLCGLFEGTAPC